MVERGDDMLAIITARGGSKRIPRKNIKEFYGKPIINYSIEAALASHLFDEVMVSTEDEEIASVAQQYGAKVPFLRSKEMADDFAVTYDVLREVIQGYEKCGRTFDTLCCLYPTAPFITADILRDAYDAFRTAEADELIPVVRFSYPPQRAFVLREGYLKYRWPENRNKRSQDLEPFYHDVGQFYFLRTDALFIENPEERKTAAFIMDEMHVQDIDNPEDWAVAELKYRLCQEL